MIRLNDEKLILFANKAKLNGISNKSAFVTWFREEQGASASQERLYKAWYGYDSIPSKVNIRVYNTRTSYKDAKIYSLLNEYKKDLDYGSFYLNKDENISGVLTKNNIPNKYGVYIIFSMINKEERIIYIGKSGTMQTNGMFKNQGISARLKATGEKNISRNIYFQNIIRDYKYDKLKFIWIVTVNDKTLELPALTESKLLQAFYDDNKRLPLLNKSI